MMAEGGSRDGVVRGMWDVVDFVVLRCLEVYADIVLTYQQDRVMKSRATQCHIICHI